MSTSFSTDPVTLAGPPGPRSAASLESTQSGPARQSPPGPDLAVASEGLTKQFGRQIAVNGIDLAVPRGEVYGFLGPNGSGKTTTIRMLLGLIRPSAGRHSLLGQPFPQHAGAVLPRVGSLVEGPAFHPYLSGLDNLARLDAADRTVDPRTASRRIGAALERVGLLAAAGKRYRAYSLGMRQRLALAAALLAPRDLLILDEPTNGLDPQGTREVRALIGALAAEGTTVMLSTHLLSEVEQVCGYVGVMHLGRLVAQAPLAELRAAAQPQAKISTDAPERAAAILAELGGTEIAARPGECTGLLGATPPERVVAALVHADIAVRGFAVVAPDLEDLFVSLTGEGFDVAG